MTPVLPKDHPAPFPFELASRLVRMFSFTGDTVLDPFCGTGTTMLAAMKYARNSIGMGIDPEYFRKAGRLLQNEAQGLFSDAEVVLVEMVEGSVQQGLPIQGQYPEGVKAGLRRSELV